MRASESWVLKTQHIFCFLNITIILSLVHGDQWMSSNKHKITLQAINIGYFPIPGLEVHLKKSR